MRGRGVGTVVGAAVAVAAVAGAGTWVAADIGDHDGAAARVVAPADAVPVPAYLEATEHGITVGLRTSVAGTATLREPVLLAGAEQVEASIWPLDGRDHEGEDLSTATLRTGGRVDISGVLSPACSASPALDAGDVVVRVEQDTDDGDPDASGMVSYVADDPTALTTAIAAWCALGPSVRPTGAMTSPDGSAEAYLQVTNPGPGPVEFELPAGDGWEATSLTVPAGTADASMTLRGTGVSCVNTDASSWTGGRLLVDGEPYPLRLADSWCG